MEYEINKGTLAIMPNEEDKSLVYEDEGEIFNSSKSISNHGR